MKSAMARKNESGDALNDAVTSSQSIRIALRPDVGTTAMIQRAAALIGIPVSDFVLQHALEAARRVLADKGTYVLSEKDFAAFIAACASPDEPTQPLRNLMARPQR